MSQGFRLKIPCSFVFLHCVVFNQGCCLIFYLKQSAGALLQMDANANLNPDNRLFITWANISFRISISHLSIFKIVVHGRFYTFYYILLVFYYFLRLCVSWFLLFVFIFMSLGSSLRNQEPILSNPTIETILVLLNWIIVDYFILLYRYYLFSIAFIILLLFSFLIYYSDIHLSNSVWSCVTFGFLSCIYVIVFILIFIIIFPQDLLSQKCRVKTIGSILFSLYTYTWKLDLICFLMEKCLKFYFPNLMTFT